MSKHLRKKATGFSAEESMVTQQTGRKHATSLPSISSSASEKRIAKKKKVETVAPTLVFDESAFDAFTRTDALEVPTALQAKVTVSPPPTPKNVPEEEVHKKKDEEDDESTGSGTNFSYSSEDLAEKELSKRALRKANKHLRNQLRFIEITILLKTVLNRDIRIFQDQLMRNKISTPAERTTRINSDTAVQIVRKVMAKGIWTSANMADLTSLNITIGLLPFTKPFRPMVQSP
jgi:hypothetical protein